MIDLRDPSFYLIGASALCGLANVPGWVAIPFAALGFLAETLPRYIGMRSRARAMHKSAAWGRVVILLVVGATAIGAGAFVLGRIGARVLGCT